MNSHPYDGKLQGLKPVEKIVVSRFRFCKPVFNIIDFGFNFSIPALGNFDFGFDFVYQLQIFPLLFLILFSVCFCF